MACFAVLTRRRGGVRRPRRPARPIPEGDLAQNALPGEADAFKYLLLRQVVGVGAGLQPMHGREPEQVVHQKLLRHRPQPLASVLGSNAAPISKQHPGDPPRWIAFQLVMPITVPSPETTARLADSGVMSPSCSQRFRHFRAFVNPNHSNPPSAAGSVSSRSRNPRSSCLNARSVRLPSIPTSCAVGSAKPSL